MSLLLLFGGSALPAGIVSLVCGYMEVPPEPEFDSYVSQIIEDVPSVTGSGTATESGDTSTGSGSQSTTGTGSPTESADTASGAGTQSLTGSGATTEGADTVSGSGTASTTGSGTATETGDTSSGTGTASTSGSGAITEGGDTASGAGSGGGTGASDALILRAGYYEEAPERIEVYGSFLSFVEQASGSTGSGSITEGGDTASGTGTAEGDAVLVLDFQDEDWDREVEESSLSLIFEAPVFTGSGGITEGGDTCNGVLGSTGGETFTGGFFYAFEKERARREKARRKRLEDEEEASRIKDEVDREIARLLLAQQALEAEQAEVQRLTALVQQAQRLRSQEAFNARVSAALDRATQKTTISALLAFEREVQRQMDAEDSAVLLLLLND